MAGSYLYNIIGHAVAATSYLQQKVLAKYDINLFFHYV